VWRARRSAVEPLLPAETVRFCDAVFAELELDPAAAGGQRVPLERSATYRSAVARLLRTGTRPATLRQA
jgi:hypothetical protein